MNPMLLLIPGDAEKRHTIPPGRWSLHCEIAAIVVGVPGSEPAAVFFYSPVQLYVRENLAITYRKQPPGNPAVPATDPSARLVLSYQGPL
jgi:hypothetical protein